MEQPSSSSKVTVEYFDPHGVYQLLSPGLLSRLPLRNLHWESHAGPLRSISSLHVDLVPSAHDTANTAAASSASVSNSSLSRVRSQDSASGDDGFRTQALGKAALERSDSRTGPTKQVPKERRHQIPGLRQTPYLKVFLLRCDDNDSYKNYARKEVRDWIKEHTPPAQSTTKVSNQENHDAYEWLIIHVIVPNTAAATQPRVSGKGAEGSGSTAEKATARWRGGGSTTILEKLRADFNGSSKSAIDRIAQIRIGINDVPYEMLPRVVPAIPGSYSETAHENETAWLDLINKFKSQILASFDMRVSQYEEDIREKDAQRSLPGWNFCTFFVLKEGLARGFESVGLVEDALVGYDELSVGLDAIIREKSTSGAGAQHGGSFLPYTEDLKLQVERAKEAFLKEKGPESVTESEDPIDLQSTGNSSVSEDEIPLDATKKRYRELILSNDVSIFDFRCYLFARQLSLLLRLANAWSSQEELLAKLKEQRESSLQGVAARNPTSKPSEDVENLVMLGEVCKRAMNFVAAIGSIMREDILASSTHSQQNLSTNSEKHAPDLEKDPVMAKIVDNIVASFTFGITQQILAQTSTKSLPIPPSTLAPPSSKLGLDGHEPKAAIPEPKTMMHPARSTSLAIRSQSHREPPSPGLFPGGRRASLPDPGATSTFLKTGLEDLAAHRAELYLLARNVLERVGKEHGWSVGWVELANEKAGDMEDVDLEETYFTPRGGENGQPTTSHPLHGIESKLLRTALDNQDDFYRLYETLTDKALRHYTVASHTQCVQSRMADLAVLKYRLNDYAAAASYFYRMTPFYGEGGWDEIELNMLKMYAKCLKELQRKEDYIRIALKILAKAADIEKERPLHKSALRVGRLDNFDHDTTEIDLYMVELLQLTKALQHEIHVPLQSFFSRVEVDDAPHYFTDKDGISLKLRFRYLLAEQLNIEKVRLRVVAATGEAGREIWLETEGPVLFKKGFVNVHVQTNMVIPGTYLVTHFTLHTSNIVLDYAHENSSPPVSRSEAFFRSPKLLIYHRAEAFDLKMFASRYMHLDRNRSLEIELSSGWNNVSKGELHVRAATAGLRVQTSQATVISGAVEIFKNSEVGVVQFGSLEPNSHAKLRMPFTLEHEVNDISLKLEVSYTTDKGDFFFATTPTMSIMLPLGVNVQDVFKHKALFSRFTISSSTDSPLRLLSSKLDNSEVFEADCGLGITKPVVIYPRQPASLLYKITKTAASTSAARNDPKSSLSLVLHYICLEEEIDLAVTQSLSQALKDTPLYRYARLVIPTVLSQLHANMSPYDLERTAVLNEVSTSILTSIHWQDHFAGLGRAQEQEKDTATLLSERLKQWLQQSPGINLLPISLDQNAIAGSRSITIPVDVPSVTVVHTADLRLLESSTVVANTAVAATNQPIPASLHVKWTTTWDTESSSEQRRPSQANANISELPEYLEFIYEVLAPSDTWLIGGKRKGHFKVSTGSQKRGQRKTFPVILIPLREGYLPYPHVEIQPAPVARPPRSGLPGIASADGEEAKPVVTCETDYKNSGETVKVISDARKTTVSLDASGPQGGAWLLESERRTGGLVTG